jgi:murein DD-endopeptidase MepM/ murein hydrolase activator NlpD
MRRLWYGLLYACLLIGFASHAQDDNSRNLEGDNPPIYLADGFDLPLGTEEERHSLDLWASHWDSRWRFGIPQNDVFSAGLLLYTAGDSNHPVYAPASGVVIFADEVFPYGDVIVMRHDPLFRQDGLIIYSRLAGLHQTVVEAAERVARGQWLGESPSQLEFALSDSAILAEIPTYQPENRADLEAHFLDPYPFIAAHRPRLAQVDAPFPLPLGGEISQDFSPNHPAIDIDAPIGTAIFASAEGLVIRRMDCMDCERVFPCHGREYQNAALGFGYGNFLILRYEGILMPEALREVMQAYELRYAYLLYAHLSELAVDYGEMVDAGTNLAAVGMTACVSAPSLHLELRIGNAESVDGLWQQQAVLDPAILFEMPEN